MNSVESVQNSLEFNRRYFSVLENYILKSKYLMVKRAIAKRAIKLAVWSSTGRYCSPIIESVYLELARKIHTPVKSTFSEGSTLHVITECYGVGGHSKVVERWISNSGNNEKHSIVFTGQAMHAIPHDFLKLVEDKNGRIISLSSAKLTSSKAKRLRYIASGYERVVLHTHMYDVVPLIAFGSEEFTRPVVLYNHADHLFWLGVSIADVVAETREWGQKFTQKYRGINSSLILSIPPNANLDRAKHSGVAKDKTKDCIRILSVGAAHKYVELTDNNFTRYMKWVLSEYSHAEFLLVGPTSEQFPQWAALEKEYSGRILVLGPRSNSELHELMLSSQLIIDSFPMSGGTALGEAVSLGIPVLALQSVTGHLDYTYKSESYCDTFSDLLHKTERFFNEPNYKNVLSIDIYNHFCDSENIEQWKVRLNEILKALPEKHNVNNLNAHVEYDFSELDKFILTVSESKRLVFNLFGLIGVFYYRKRGFVRFSLGKII